MPSFYLGKIPIIKSSLNEGFLRGEPGTAMATGCVPRDFSIDPVEMRDSPAGIELYDEGEYQKIHDRLESEGSSLVRRYLAGPGDTPVFDFLNQNGFPDCWAHSTGHGLMMDHVIRNLPVVRLNAVGAATLMKQTNGGWCGLSAKFARENGYPVIGNGVGEWPYLSRKGKDTPELRTKMAFYKSEEEWYDLGKPVYDQELGQKQLITLGFSIHPCPADWNPYAHSMLYMGPAMIDGRPKPIVLNSWEGWGHYGLGVLPFWPDNAVCIRSTVT